MANFWFVSAPLVSHADWGGFWKTAKALQAEGHRVLWVSEPSMAQFIASVDIPFQPVEKTGWLWPPPPQPDLSQLTPQEAVMLRYTRALDTWLSEDLVAEGTQALIELAGTIGKPDIIATDPFLSAAALAAEALNIPMVSCGWPAQSDLSESNLFPVQRTLGTDSQQRLRRLCERFGLNGRNFAKGPTPSVQSPHLHICYFTEDWYAAEWDTLLPQNVYVGGHPAQPVGSSPEWLREIPVEKPLAVVTLGTVFTGDLGFFSWSAQAAAHAGLLPIVVIGWNPITPDQKQGLVNALPRGTRLLNWIPFDHVLPRTSLMIHHGGMGTTHYALVHGIPQIVVPHAADQRIQAKRVAQAKVGLNLSAHDVRQGLLLEGTQAILKEDSVLQRAQSFAHDMSAGGGVRHAAKVMLDVI